MMRSRPSGILAPLATDLDLTLVADEIEVAGGTIRNAVQRATFLAAEGRHPSRRRRLRSSRGKLHKIGRLITAYDFERLGRQFFPSHNGFDGLR
jgi:hypothetical protein